MSEQSNEEIRVNTKIETLLGRHAYLGVVYPGSRCTACGEAMEDKKHFVIRPNNYLNAPAAALTLCDRLIDEGWNVDIFKTPGAGWKCVFSRLDSNNKLEEHACEDASLPVAICKPFLKAKESK